MFPTILNEMMLIFNSNPFFCCSVKFANAVVLQIAWNCGLQLGLWGEKERGEKKWRAGNWGREGTTLLLPSITPGATQLASLINFSFFRYVSFRSITPTAEHGPKLFSKLVYKLTLSCL